MIPGEDMEAWTDGLVVVFSQSFVVVFGKKKLWWLSKHCPNEPLRSLGQCLTQKAQMITDGKLGWFAWICITFLSQLRKPFRNFSETYFSFFGGSTLACRMHQGFKCLSLPIPGVGSCWTGWTWISPFRSFFSMEPFRFRRRHFFSNPQFLEFAS